jgi:hypothetical protein
MSELTLEKKLGFLQYFGNMLEPGFAKMAISYFFSSKYGDYGP